MPVCLVPESYLAMLYVVSVRAVYLSGGQEVQNPLCTKYLTLPNEIQQES